MEEWDVNENQGRRKDQIEITNKIVFYCLIGIIITIIGNGLYLWLKWVMAKARKEGKKKRNRGNLVKNRKRIEKVNELLNKLKKPLK